MGTLENIEIGEVLTVRTYKTVPGSPIAWANSYEVVSNIATSDTQTSSARINNLINIISNFERAILFVAYVLDKIIVSTYVPDGTPYNPYTFVAQAINLAGQYATPGYGPLPLQLCTLVKRNVPFGRLGNLLFRGIVSTRDADITSSGTIITAARINQIQDALDSFLNQLATNDFTLVMARGRNVVETSTLRVVTGLNARRDMRFKKLDNRYFDRLRQ
jgi:hypothetical protein